MMPLLGLKDRFSKERFSAGVDIGTSVIKVVKLKFCKDKVDLYSFDLETNQTDSTQALKKITPLQLQDVKKINISVSGPAAIIRYVNFPRMSAEELSKALKFEAEKHIPFSVSEMHIDACILKPELTDYKMLVLLAAVKKEFIEQRLKSLEDMGLRVNIVDVDSLALINAFDFNYLKDDDNLKNKTIALLNIGASFSNLNILEGGIPRLSRDIPIAGNNFTRRLADILGLDFKSAEELKLKPDREKADKVVAAQEPVLSNLANEVRTSFDYYESQSASTVVKIFLSGGCSLSKGLKDRLTALLGIEVEHWNPLKRIGIPSTVDSQRINIFSSQLAVAIGLALR